MPVSQNNWPALEAGSRKLHRWKIPVKGGTVEITMRNGSAGFILSMFVIWYDNHIEPVYQKLLDDWGWAYRPVRGQSKGLSNHASGTAIDINATRHPLGRVGTLAFKVKSGVATARIKYALSHRFKNIIRAGAFYKGRKDEMHYEIVSPLSTCEKFAREWMNRPVGKKILDANPSQRSVILS